jgi:hypothetical protein
MTRPHVCLPKLVAVLACEQEALPLELAIYVLDTAAKYSCCNAYPDPLSTLSLRPDVIPAQPMAFWPLYGYIFHVQPLLLGYGGPPYVPESPFILWEVRPEIHDKYYHQVHV